VCAAGVLWGTGGLVVTALHHRDGLGAMPISAWRMAIAAVALLGYAVLLRQVPTVLRTFREHPVTVTLVGCGTAAYQALFFGAVLLVGVSVATVVSLGLAPPLAAAWEHIAGRTRPSSRQVAVLVTAVAGLVLVSLAAGDPSSAAGDRPRLGVALAVASGATYAATTLLGGTLARRIEPTSLNTCATVAGAVVLSPFAVVPALAHSTMPAGDPASVALLLYLGVVPMAVAYALLYSGLRTTSGSAATLATLLEPLSASLLAFLLLDERLSWAGLVGGALILVAVAALRPGEDQLSDPPPDAPPPDLPVRVPGTGRADERTNGSP
jgi:DME family drug/metabolite transporter